MNMNKLKHELLQEILVKKIFELTFPDQNLDNFTKTDLAYLLIQIDKEARDRIKKAKDPHNTISSEKLVDSYVRSCKTFPPLQQKLVKTLSNQKKIELKVLVKLVYKYKNNENYNTAIRKLISETNKTFIRTGSGDVFRIINKTGFVWLNINDAFLLKNVKKRSPKITK